MCLRNRLCLVSWLVVDNHLKLGNIQKCLGGNVVDKNLTFFAIIAENNFSNSNLECDFATCYYFVKHCILCQTVLFPWLLTYFSFSSCSTGRKVSQVRGTLDKTCAHCTVKEGVNLWSCGRREAPILARSKGSSDIQL